MEWLPSASVDVLRVAVVGFVPESVPVPRLVPPLKNVTVPVAPAVAVAVKVTELPKADGLVDEATKIVEAGSTVCERAELVLEL